MTKKTVRQGCFPLRYAKRVAEPGEGEPAEEDPCRADRRAVDHVEQSEHEEGHDVDVRVALGAKHASDLGRIFLEDLGAFGGRPRVFRVGRRLCLAAHAAAPAPKAEHVEAEDDGAEGVDRE